MLSLGVHTVSVSKLHTSQMLPALAVFYGECCSWALVVGDGLLCVPQQVPQGLSKSLYDEEQGCMLWGSQKLGLEGG